MFCLPCWTKITHFRVNNAAYHCHAFICVCFSFCSSLFKHWWGGHWKLCITIVKRSRLQKWYFIRLFILKSSNSYKSNENFVGVYDFFVLLSFLSQIATATIKRHCCSQQILGKSFNDLRSICFLTQIKL